MGYIREPEKLATLIGAFRGLTPAAPAVQTPMAIGSPHPGQTADLVTQPGAAMVDQSDQDAMALRVATVLDRLEKADPHILVHLEKLADLAEKKPGLFKLLLAQLDGL